MKFFKVKYTIFGKEHSGIFHASSEDGLENRLSREYSLWTVLEIEEIGGKHLDAAK